MSTDEVLAGVGPRLRQIRKEREVTLAGLSEATGISVSTLSRLESGLRKPSLELLPEVQRTGDIFFPKRWMDMTLGGHRSAEAAAIVRAFLDRAGPSYPDRLRRIILSAADDLFRASRM